MSSSCTNVLARQMNRLISTGFRRTGEVEDTSILNLSTDQLIMKAISKTDSLLCFSQVNYYVLLSQ